GGTRWWSCGPGTGRSPGRATGATRRGTGRSAARRTRIAARSYVARRCRRKIRRYRPWRACVRKSAGSFGASCDGSHDAVTSGKVQFNDLPLEQRIFRLLPPQHEGDAVNARCDLAIPGRPEVRCNVLQAVRVDGEVNVGPDRPQHVECLGIPGPCRRCVRGSVLAQHLLDVSLLVTPVVEKRAVTPG